MKTRLSSWRFVAPVALAGAIFGSFACSSSSSDPSGTTGTDGGGSSGASTFTEVYAIMTRAPGNCVVCHASGVAAQGGLDLSTQALAFTNLVGVAAGTTGGAVCSSSGDQRVTPGNSGASLLYQKVANMPTCGVSMPFGGMLLSASDVATIKSWIDEGAPNN